MTVILFMIQALKKKHWTDYISCFKYSCDNVEERNEYQNEKMTRKKWQEKNDYKKSLDIYHRPRGYKPINF